ncbi:MAG: protein phosphatase CheZ [Pseudomonadota bacterium]
MTENSDIADSEDLEALFDSIVAANKEAEALAKGVPAVGSNYTASAPGAAGLNPALICSELAADYEWGTPSSQPQLFKAHSSDVIDQIGHLTRSLHDALRELGLNKKIEKAASSIPDARDRLNYVATLTHQAAERVLNATEAAQPLVEKMEVEAHRLSGQWQKMFEKQLDVEEFKDLAMQTRAFLQDVPKQTKATHAYLMEIMMAQDFQDLTGQVIKKIIDITENLERQLLALLLENAPAKVKADMDTGLLSGPEINPGGRKDVVSNQSRVDDLLEGLGF